MDKVVYLCVACDTDPDRNPPYRTLPCPAAKDDLWQGVLVGIPTLRQRLAKSRLASRYGQLPITWLLRADRQMSELYGDPGFCFARFEKLWRFELRNGSEIGWHPHLYRWEQATSQWEPYLGKTDDLEILDHCLRRLCQYMDVQAVRTGWDYHSNSLLGFFDQAGLLVDASAIPGVANDGTRFYDWRGTPRTPYFPSKLDYRRPARSQERAWDILEMPVIVRSLNLPLHILRHGLRKLRFHSQLSPHRTDWKSSRHQGMRITSECAAFAQSIQQTLETTTASDRVYAITYFHSGELLAHYSLERFVQNLDSLLSLAERMNCTLVPTTLSVAAHMVKEELLQGSQDSGGSRVMQSEASSASHGPLEDQL